MLLKIEVYNNTQYDSNGNITKDRNQLTVTGDALRLINFFIIIILCILLLHLIIRISSIYRLFNFCTL